MTVYAVVDSGTTNTRVRLVTGGQVAWSGSRPVGARDTAREGSPSLVIAALQELLAEAPIEQPAAMICSGMITSNMGLLEVPHLPAPASLDDIATGIVQREFPELGVLSFIPGVKTVPAGDSFAALAAGDVLRGEEAEIAGLLAELILHGDSVFLHFGSHHKAIDVDQDGRILGSRTAITGELLAAILERTVLRSSLLPLEDVELDMEAALAGAAAAQSQGLGRALFLVRVGEQLAGRTREAMTSYCLGALATLDLPLLHNVDESAQIILYGQGIFPLIVERLLEHRGHRRPVRLIPAEIAERCAATGAVALFERAAELKMRA